MNACLPRILHIQLKWTDLWTGQYCDHENVEWYLIHRHTWNNSTLGYIYTSYCSIQQDHCKKQNVTILWSHLGPCCRTEVTAATKWVAPPTLVAAVSNSFMWMRACCRVLPRLYRTRAACRKFSQDTFWGRHKYALVIVVFGLLQAKW